MSDDLRHIIIKSAGADVRLDAADVAELRRACVDCPASVVAPMLLLKYCDEALGADERENLRMRVALYSGDPASVISMIDPAGNGFAHFYPPELPPPPPSTERTIDTFLETYGHRSPEEDALLERMIFNPVPDYAETLARESAQAGDAGAEAAPGSQDALIDAFLAANPVDGERTEPLRPEPEPRREPARHAAPSKPKEPAEDSLLSESLAKIFIKQGRYERAYEIISNLSLNYPKKSIYFADQLRFLQKLIVNQRAGNPADK
ncbi:MAG: hypothetical protein Q4C34_05035 [Bacteroidales bacterium]|nr:hypothetical protein [Bacteroidales bacterium]